MANYFLPVLVILGIGAVTYVPVLLGMAFDPKTTTVGYQPVQPVPFSHALHAGDLGLDCRYCHNTVETSAFAAIPPTATCMNCHTGIHPESARLAPVRDSFTTGKPVDWKKIHDLPDFVTFNHSIHVNKGVGCATCHGRIDKMEVVAQAKTLSMSWCLECHREPEKFLRPRDQVTNMAFDPVRDTGKSQLELGRELKQLYEVKTIAYMTSCSTCHH